MGQAHYRERVRGASFPRRFKRCIGGGAISRFKRREVRARARLKLRLLGRPNWGAFFLFSILLKSEQF